jgi:hypothetical protein
LGGARFGAPPHDIPFEVAGLEDLLRMASHDACQCPEANVSHGRAHGRAFRARAGLD